MNPQLALLLFCLFLYRALATQKGIWTIVVPIEKPLLPPPAPFKWPMGQEPSPPRPPLKRFHIGGHFSISQFNLIHILVEGNPSEYLAITNGSDVLVAIEYFDLHDNVLKDIGLYVVSELFAEDHHYHQGTMYPLMLATAANSIAAPPHPINHVMSRSEVEGEWPDWIHPGIDIAALRNNSSYHHRLIPVNRLLGKGNTGRVHLFINNSTIRLLPEYLSNPINYLAKKEFPKWSVLDRTNTRDKVTTLFHGEIEVVKAIELNDPYLTPICMIKQTSTNYEVWMEGIFGGSFKQMLLSVHSMHERETAYYTEYLLTILLHCEDKRIMLGDLKPENILIDGRGGGGYLRVIDFGNSRITQEDGRVEFGKEFYPDNGMSSHHMGTIYYLAPENINREKFLSSAIDVWAVGVILFEMITHQRMWDSYWKQQKMNINVPVNQTNYINIKMETMEVIKNFKSAEFSLDGFTSSGSNNNISQGTVEVMRALLNENPKERTIERVREVGEKWGWWGVDGERPPIVPVHIEEGIVEVAVDYEHPVTHYKRVNTGELFPLIEEA